MFTGIIEEIGEIKGIHRGSKSVALEIGASRVLEDLHVGDSVATNGVCLTVTSFSSVGFRADVMPETMRCTNLGALRPGDRVNLERALCLNARLGGHIVSGHVDGTGKIVRLRQEDNAIWVTIAASPEVLRYVVKKGSITIDGISLTVARVEEETFSVSIIPHTSQETTLTTKGVGAIVNLENDVLAKYVERLLHPAEKTQEKSTGLSLDFLMENGF